MRRILGILLVFILFFIFSTKAFAESNFSTDYNVNYNVESNTTTHVSINASLKNLTDKYYASSYSIQVGFTDVNNLKASDSEGRIEPKVTKTSKGSTITLNFNQRVVGLNNKLDFNITFDTTQVAENFNNTWDINIPGVSNENDFASFNVNVTYPSFLGKPTFIKPVTLSTTSQKSGNNLSFTKEDLGYSGISIAFGDFQIYDLNLTYHLKNPNLFPISTEIALPPDTNYQTISIDSLNPRPINVTTDKDGNWLAKYILDGGKDYNIKLIGKAKVFITPKSENLDKNLEKEYLTQKEYWNSNNPKIQALAKELKTPYAIYKYVINTLSYDFSRVETSSPRLGALEALKNPDSAVCLEFTDLFIAIARAAGIPAREINGYAYTSNTSERPLSFVKDILHAWPEYYDFDKKAWIMVDPTWGNTTGGVDYFSTLDFNHIAFVVKGLSSSYPIPAGGYKLVSDKNKKDVEVEIGSSFTPKVAEPEIEIQFSDEVLSGIPVNGIVKVSNVGSTLINGRDVNVSTNSLTPKTQSVMTNSIPPYGYQIMSLSFDRTSFLTNIQDTIKITVDNKPFYKTIKILPFFVNKLFMIGGLTFASIIIILSIIAYIYRRVSILRQKRQDNLRGESPKP
jgi:hypothetical protein